MTASGGDLEALGPSLLVVAFFLIAAPFLPRGRTWSRSLVVALAALVAGRYLWWRFTETLGPESPLDSIQSVWVVFCFVVEALAFAEIAINLLTLSRHADRSPEADRHEARLRSLPREDLPSVDVFIPTYNEELDVLERTIVGALGLDYPNFTVWVLDDGRRDWLREFCERKGARYLTRPDNSYAKAGNINHALQHTSGDLVAIFDADVVAHRNFLYRTVGFFADAGIGCVQTRQEFFNKDPIQTNLGLYRFWPEEQRFFFDRVMPSRDAWDCAFCCGAGSITRRRDLMAIGGVPTGSVTEDMLTTLTLLRHGAITRYLNERLSVGLSPESVSAFFVQRQRWCRGNVQQIFLPNGPFGPGLSLLQRLLFAPAYWMIQLPTRILSFVIPVACLWGGLLPLLSVTADQLIAFQLPVFVALIAAMRWLAPNTYLPFLATASNLFTALRIAPTAMAALIRPFGVPFKVTPKGAVGAATRPDRVTLMLCGALLLATIGGLAINTIPDWNIVGHSALFPIAALWAIVNAVILFVVLLLAVDAPRRRCQERFPLSDTARWATGAAPATGDWADCRLLDASLTGLQLEISADGCARPGERIIVDMPNVGMLAGHVIRTAGRRIGLRFEGLLDDARDRLVRRLYTEGIQNNAEGDLNAAAIASRLLRRAFGRG